MAVNKFMMAELVNSHLIQAKDYPIVNFSSKRNVVEQPLRKKKKTETERPVISDYQSEGN